MLSCGAYLAPYTLLLSSLLRVVKYSRATGTQIDDIISDNPNPEYWTDRSAESRTARVASRRRSLLLSTRHCPRLSCYNLFRRYSFVKFNMSFRHTLRSVARTVATSRHAQSTGALRALHGLPPLLHHGGVAPPATQCSRRHFATPPPQVKHRSADRTAMRLEYCGGS